jgi:hypothetical protein
MIAEIKPANMKIFNGFSITTLPKTRILDWPSSRMAYLAMSANLDS